MFIRLETERLYLQPLSLADALALAEAERDPELHQAYLEMAAEMQKLPGREYWGAPWELTLRDGTPVGDACFKGVPDAKGCVELGYGVNEAFRNRGYASEAVSALAHWALRQEGCSAVTAQTEPENRISQRVLEKCGFIPCGMGDEGPLFTLTVNEKS